VITPASRFTAHLEPVFDVVGESSMRDSASRGEGKIHDKLKMPGCEY
jgi:hypothetical protein